MPAAVNQELTSELSSAYIYFKEKENIYNSLPAYEAQIQTTLVKCDRTFLKNKWLTFACFILYCWTCYGSYDDLIAIYANSKFFTKTTEIGLFYLEKLFGNAHVAGFCGVIINLAFILFLYALFIGIFFIARHYLIKLVLWERRKIYEPTIIQTLKNSEDCVTALLSHYQTFNQTFQFECPIPFHYSHPEIISAVARYVMIGRADTIKEALNLMHMEANYGQMLNIQSQILISVQNTERYAYSAANSARWAAWNTFFR